MKIITHFSLLIQLLRNMGCRYVLFRIWFEIQKRTGLLKIRFPKQTKTLQFVTLPVWRNLPVNFFKPDFDSLRDLKNEQDFKTLQNRVQSIHQSSFQLFSGESYVIADWHTNPITRFQYDRNQHWSEIRDFVTEAGDIKYVWEKSRFCFIYDLIRYDLYFNQDQSKMVFDQIESWIDLNPVNCGPNWKCSQELSLRVLNWTFALHYYKNSVQLTEVKLNKILSSIYRQMQHVADNIWFSKTLVRNNHALTEALSLYLIGLLYPFFPESTRWKENGKKWFEEETAFQIGEDGSYLQHSMNYHRVVVQLLTWGIHLAELNGERWSETVNDRARQCVLFLRNFQDEKTGWLPNYGNNDGALFFPLSNCHFRDFRPQLNALAKVLQMDLGYIGEDWKEDALWLGIENVNRVTHYYTPNSSPFSANGYHVLKDIESLTFIRCGSYKHRPFQADNLHLDIWVNGENILRDAGSYSYFTDPVTSSYFMGTASHNTVMLDGFDQMKKGSGFIWDGWVRRSKGGWRREDKDCVFEGEFEGFKHLKKGIIHRRRVTKKYQALHWIVEDWIENLPQGVLIQQLWHPSEAFFERFSMRAFDGTGSKIQPVFSRGWYSEVYGQRQSSVDLRFSTKESYIRTVIVDNSIKL